MCIFDRRKLGKLSFNQQIKKIVYTQETILPTAAQGMLWNEMENGMEWKENFGMEYGRCLEWNQMEDLKIGLEDGLPYFHTNYIDSPIRQNLQQITK